MVETDARVAFSIATDPWVPVIYLDGSRDELSMVDVFDRAASIRRIQGDVPMQELPMVRLLLAILYRAESPSDVDEGTFTKRDALEYWQGLWMSGKFDMNCIRGYLEYFSDRFYLDDPSHPFYQVPDLEYVGKEPDGVDELVADVPKPEKFLFSMRARGTISDLSLAEGVRWLIFQQSYAPAGIKTPVVGNSHVKSGKVYAPKGSVGTGLLGAEGGVFLEGENLFQTLMLNWVLFDEKRKNGHLICGNAAGIPSWEADETTPDLVPATIGNPGNPVGAYTWQSRRMRLVFDKTGQRVVGVVSCYGDIPSIVNGTDAEPMTAWRKSEAQQKKLGLPSVPLMPRAHDSERAIWRGLSAIVATEKESEDCRPGVVRWVELLQEEEILPRETLPYVAIHAQGMSYGTQSSVFEDGVDDVLDVSSALLRHDSPACLSSLNVIAQADEAVELLVRFVRNVQRASGDKSAKDRARVKSSYVRAQAFGEIDHLCRDRIAHFPDDGDTVIDEYCIEWRAEIRSTLLALEGEYLRECAPSLFAERYEKPEDKKSDRGVTVGKADAIFRASLNKALSPLYKEKDSSKTVGSATLSEGM